MKRLVLLMTVAALVNMACALGSGAPTAPDASALSTQVAATVNAALNKALPTLAPTLAPTTPPVGPPPATNTLAAPTQAPLPPATNTSVAPTQAPPPTTQATSTGGPASFSPITFAIGENNENPVDALDTFPGGVTRIYAIFSGVNLKDGQAWKNEWYYNGQLQANLSESTTWDAATAGPAGVWWLTVYNPKGIRSGTWELKLYIDGNLVQSGQATIEANVTPDFGPITFAGGVDSSDQPVGPVDVSDPTFTNGITQTFAFFNGINVPKGTAWQTQWFFNGNPSDSKDHTWNFALNEQDWLQFGTTDGSALKPGTYELKLSIGGTVVNIGSFVVAN